MIRSSIYVTAGQKQSRHRCKNCGEVFYGYAGWKYRNQAGSRENWFCRYTCMRAYMRAHEEKIGKKKTQMPEEV